MIEPEDLMIPGNISTFDRAKTEIIASRLSQLESRPVVGAYDAVHLQQIHARIFQDLFPWAGQFRAPESPSSLDVLFDRLARENRLKGLDGDAWSKRSTEYLRELTTIEPFIGGNDLASFEFFRQLASENNMTLRWTKVLDEISQAELTAKIQTIQSNSLRRIIMLAVDPYPTGTRPSREIEGRNARELSDLA